MANWWTSVDGIEYDADPAGVATAPNPALSAGRKLNALGQTGNTVAGTVANQAHGTVACPALAAGATGTVTITNSLITTKSLIFVAARRGTTTPAAGAYCMVQDVLTPTSGSVVVNVVNLGSAATLSTDEQLWFWIVN